MTNSRIRCFTVLTIAFGIAMLASNQAIAQRASQNKMRIKAANQKKKADAAAKKAKAGGVTDDARTKKNNRLAVGGQPIGNAKEDEHPKNPPPSAKKSKKPTKSKGYKPPWVLWREAHPEEAEIEIQQAAAQMRENEKRLGRIGFTNSPPSSAPKRQNRENSDGTTAAGGAPDR
jgi:hypothetical protein